MKPRHSGTKRLTRAKAIEASRTVRARGETLVFTNGCFDILHVGHTQSLEQARSMGDRLIVALNSDSSVRALKGQTRPLVPLSQRMRVIASLECVDWVISFRSPTPLSLIQDLRPDVIAKGGDWKLDEIVGREAVESWGGRVARLTEVQGVHTSHLIQRIRQ